MACIINGFNLVGMDSDEQVDVLLAVWGEKISVFIWAANISLNNSVMGQVTGTEALRFPSSIIYPAYQFERLSSRVYINTNIIPMLENWTFHSRAQLESPSELLLVIISTNILDSQKSLDSEKIPWTRRHCRALWLHAPAASKISRHIVSTYFCCSKIQRSDVGIGMRARMTRLESQDSARARNCLQGKPNRQGRVEV